MQQKLCGLRCGQWARVEAVGGAEGMRRRLQDLGLIEGTRVECLHQNRAGDLSAYRIRGAVIALRREDAQSVQVTGEGWLPSCRGGSQGGDRVWD